MARVYSRMRGRCLHSSVLGHRLALSTGINEDSHLHEHITGLREGLFVLLGLLLGFTIAIVLPRFDERERLVVEEADAIGTTVLRAEVLPEPQRGRSTGTAARVRDCAARFWHCNTS